MYTIHVQSISPPCTERILPVCDHVEVETSVPVSFLHNVPLGALDRDQVLLHTLDPEITNLLSDKISINKTIT